METITPGRSRDQRLDALAQANRIRTARAELKRRLKEQETVDARAQVVYTIDNPPTELERMKVLELLKAVPRVGEVKAHRILFRHQVSTSKTLGGLTLRQRRALKSELQTVDARALSPSHAA